jgi:hypothetical protein
MSEACHTPPFSAEVKKEWSWCLHCPIGLHGVVLSTYQGQLLPLYFEYLVTVRQETAKVQQLWKLS